VRVNASGARRERERRDGEDEQFVRVISNASTAARALASCLPRAFIAIVH